MVILKITLGASLLTSGTFLFFSHRIDKNAQALFNNQEFYKHGIAIIPYYKPLTNITGEPIILKRIRIMDFDTNQIGPIHAKVSVPFKSPHAKGIILMNASRKEPADKHVLHTLEVQLNSLENTIKILDQSLIPSPKN